MNVIIIEDEKLSAEHLTTLLYKIDSEIVVIKYLDTVKESIQYFQQSNAAHVIFLDIHLADGNSFEIFNQVKLNLPIIFTTAYDNYAIQAFKQNSIDYLLKPIDIKELQGAMQKLKQQQQSSQQLLVENIAQVYQQINKQYKTRFLVKQGQTIDTIQTQDIHHFETKESITFLVIKNGKRFPIDYTLEQLETMLSPHDFFRINRKVILHIRAIEKINTMSNSRLTISSNLLKDDSQVVSRERVNDFKNWLDK
jgi:DNA-binding LytR/AlgR family response regulator